MKKLISIIIPVFNEQENLPILHAMVSQHIAPLRTRYSFELIFIDDGSRDKSWQIISQLVVQDPTIRGIKLSRNFGHQAALMAGYNTAQGQAVISMDSD